MSETLQIYSSGLNRSNNENVKKQKKAEKWPRNKIFLRWVSWWEAAIKFTADTMEGLRDK